MLYTVRILKFGKLPELSDQARDVIIVGRENDTDVCVRFFCPCSNATPIYIPFGSINKEGGGNQERTIEWTEKDKILSLHPSIQVKAGCSCHYYITNNTSVGA